MEDKVTSRLSDMFAKKVESPSVELTVTALNINNGHSKELMEACKALKGYSIFVDKVRKYKSKQRLNTIQLTPFHSNFWLTKKIP